MPRYSKSKYSLLVNLALVAAAWSCMCASSSITVGRPLPPFIFASALSSASSLNKGAPRPVRNIAVIGAGIAGLATAHAISEKLLSDDGNENLLNIQLFDSRPSLDPTAGAGVQLNGGLSVLGPGLREAVYEAGLPQTTIRSKTCSGKDSSGIKTLLQLDIPSCVKNNPLAKKYLISSEDPSEKNSSESKLWWVTILRGALQEVLLDKLPKKSCRVNFGKDLVDIVSTEFGTHCVFADGSEEGPFDLIVGCDGINSVCRQFVDAGKIDAVGSSSSFRALYSGLRIRYAVHDTTEYLSNATMTQYFGDGGYALDSVYGKGAGRPITRCTFLTFMDEDYMGPFKLREPRQKVGENADWSQDNRRTLENSKLQMLKDCENYGIPNDVVGTTIEKADRFFELGVYFHNPFSPNGWSRAVSGPMGASVVLCGDAAHALPPFLGQGSNQAIQDAYCLADKLFRYNALVGVKENENVNLMVLLKEYENTRWLPTFEIFLKSVLLGYLETGGMNGFYSGFRDIFFQVMGRIGVAEKVLLGAATPKL